MPHDLYATAQALQDLPDQDLAKAVEVAVSAKIGRAGGQLVQDFIATALLVDTTLPAAIPVASPLVTASVVEPGDRASLIDELAGIPRDIVDRVSPDDVALAIEAAAHRAVLAERMYTSRAVADAVGSTAHNPRQAARELRGSGRIVAVQAGHKFLHPAFQFDLQHHRVHPVVAQVNQLLGAADDPWGVASWWVTPTPRLTGQAPKELIGTSREPDLVTLAHGEVSE